MDGLDHGRSQIIPLEVLIQFSKDKKLSAAERKRFADTVAFELEWRKHRTSQGKFSRISRTLLPSAEAIATQPAVYVYSCRNTTSIPGTFISKPATSTDQSAKRAFNETSAVATFYSKIFGRNSVDNAGKSLVSSVHYSVAYNNAFWNGSQMIYGDGDGNIFLDFTRSTDVIAHELTHGVTQYSAALAYTNEAGGLNESMSDVFGSMFRQWRAGQSVTTADWLIGKDIMGPGSVSRGYTCLRSMANPSATYCLAPQPTNYSQYRTGMDPHYSSGIPNYAFYKAAMAIGGNSWEKVGQIWYKALTGYVASPNMKMSTFASRTRTLAGTLFSSDPSIKAAVNSAWTAVGL
ncbi:MAG: M4 family metallopeptidase [Isosphaeraceae bacterium]